VIADDPVYVDLDQAERDLMVRAITEYGMSARVPPSCYRH
jgi:hypothetical protein